MPRGVRRQVRPGLGCGDEYSVAGLVGRLPPPKESVPPAELTCKPISSRPSPRNCAVQENRIGELTADAM
jgi:hypothetical protein